METLTESSFVHPRTPSETLEEVLHLGISCHRQGSIAAAQSLYQQVLLQDRNNLIALELLILTYSAQRNFSAALECCDRALELDRSKASVHHKKGCCLQELERFQAALASFDEAVRCDPNCSDFYKDRAAARLGYQLPLLAKKDYLRVIEMCPDDAETYNALGLLCNELGSGDEAIAYLEKAISVNPTSIEATHNLGNILHSLKRHDQALDAFDKVLALDNSFEPSLRKRGDVLVKLKRPFEAIQSFKKAIAICPDSHISHNNLGAALHALGDLEGAVSAYDTAISLYPNYPRAMWNKALVKLLWGNFTEGWALHEWRLQTEGRDEPLPLPNKPDWRGEEDISDKRLFIPSEQGLGDLIQFSRYAAMAVEKAGEVILEVPKMLVPVIRTLHPEITLSIKGQKPPEFDVYCPVMSLPYAFRTTLETIPTNGKYLSSDGQKVSLWQEALGPTDKKRVGLVWSGSPKHENDHNRSIPLTELVPLLSDSVEWHSLQKEYREADLAVLESMPQVSQHQDALVDFSDTAALIECLDLVITVDTSVAHLAGALGKPVWIMLPHVPDYRWLTDRDDSPWYDSVRLYRQQTSGDWSSVTDQIVSDLNS